MTSAYFACHQLERTPHHARSLSPRRTETRFPHHQRRRSGCLPEVRRRPPRHRRSRTGARLPGRNSRRGPPPAVRNASPETEETLRRLVHQINNRLNSSTIGVALLRRQLELGLTGEMTATLGPDRTGTRRPQANHRAATPRPLPPRRPAAAPFSWRDDANECELLAGFLRLAGVEVDTAGDGCRRARSSADPRPRPTSFCST